MLNALYTHNSISCATEKSIVGKDTCYSDLIKLENTNWLNWTKGTGLQTHDMNEINQKNE